MKRTVLTFVCLSTALVVTVALPGQGEEPNSFPSNPFQVGEPIPDITLPMADPAGEAFALARLTGKPAAIVFWRPNQPMSLDALRDVEQILSKLGPSAINVVAVDTSRASAEAVQTVLAGETLSYPVLLDPERELYGAAGVIVCPTTLLLDADGVLRFKAASHPRQFAHVVETRLQFLLGNIDEATMESLIEPTVLQIQHDVANAWRMYNLGKNLQAGGKLAEAAEAYQKAVSEYPALPEARCALGFMKLADADFEAAATHFQTALTYQPSSALARLGQAAVLARTGEPEAAEEILLSLLGHKSIAMRTRYELGRIYHARGQLDRATTFYEDALMTMFEQPQGTGTATVPAPAAPGSAPAAPVNRPAPVSRSTATPVDAVKPSADVSYVGVKRCKKCHLQQWKSWESTKMAGAFNALKPGETSDVKIARGLDPARDYTTDPACLKCHTSGYGYPGGYPAPGAGDPAASREAAEHAGVGCESCHGPGSKFTLIHQEILDTQRTYTQRELYQAGQYEVGPGVCAACHVTGAPCIPPDYVFDYQTRKEQGTHRHYDLRFRSN